MGLHLRKRRKLEPLATAAVPPANGDAPCLDAYSRRWGKEPIAGRFVDWAEATYHAGFGAGFCGVWRGDDPGTPIDRFAIGPGGTLAANLELRRLELIPMLTERRLPGPRLTAPAGDVTLLLAQERVGDDFHLHAGVSETAWFVHAFGVGPIPELPATEPGSATLGDALVRAVQDWDAGDWAAVPAAVPRRLFDTLAWALEPGVSAAS